VVVCQQPGNKANAFVMHSLPAALVCCTRPHIHEILQ
jgi:hypothetical protein